jgi:putative transposase
MCILPTLFAVFRSAFCSRVALELENFALRHQLNVLKRSVPRPRLTPADRYLRVVLLRVWQNWRAALAIVRPETVIAWHRQGFRLFWTWNVRRGKSGRPAGPPARSAI